MADDDCEVLVVGAGMAGASVAAHLAAHVKVILLEMEDQPGYHSTGRSAALFSENYGNRTIRALSRASRSFLFAPPADFCAAPLVRPRPVLVVGREGQAAALADFTARHAPAVEAVGADDAVALCPVLRRDGLLGGVVDRGAADIEVHELHHGYLRAFRRRGGELRTGARVTGLARGSDGWTVQTEGGCLRARTLVNAAGAWAGELGRMAGAQDIGLEPRRRTAALIDPPQGVASEAWPMILDVEERFYMKPDAGLLLVSPADETLVTPGDAAPEEIDIAIAIDRLQEATTLDVRRVRGRWAGLRSFVEDRSPVVGYDGLQAGFFWMAALGGYGIQTAPALSAMAADLVLDRPLGDQLAGFGVNRGDLAPSRLIRQRHSNAAG